MFRGAFGLRSLPRQAGTPQNMASPPAWTGLWRRMFGAKAAQRAALRADQHHHHHYRTISQLNKLRGWQSANRAGSKFAQIHRRGFHFSFWRRNTTQNGPSEKLTIRQKLRRLSKEYGWSAVGVYLGLSVLDFPFCFLLVRIVGAETIGKVEHYVVSNVKQLIPESIRQKWHEWWHAIKDAETEKLGNDHISDKVEMAGWGVKQAQEQHAEEASLGTQLALAYAIHKSFIFLRVPLTAAVTPKVVKVLRSWGWNIGKRASR